MTSSAFSTEAVTELGTRLTADGAGGTQAINYTTQGAAAADTAWVIIANYATSTIGGTNFTRVASSHYYTDVISASQPTLPADSVWLMKVTLAGSAITAVMDLRRPASLARHGVLDIMDPLYGAVGDGTTDDTAAMQAACNGPASVIGPGGRTTRIVEIPEGVFRTTAPITLLANTIVQGRGRLASLILAHHTGDGLQTTSTINTGGTPIRVVLRDFGIYTDTTSVGAGYADVAGAYITLDNVFLQSFKYLIVLDQSSHVLITNCELILIQTAGIWIVSGPDHTALASPSFSNVITISNNQFNSSAASVLLLDDGGINHNILYNNFNSGATGILAANTSNLLVEGNFFESQSTLPVSLANATAFGSVFVQPHYNPVIRGNAFSTPDATVAHHVSLSNGFNGAIINNLFVGLASMTAMMTIGNDKVVGFLIEGNTKALPQLGASPDKPFMNITLARISMQRYRQRLFTSHAAGVFAGAGVVLTPRDMGLAQTLERPRVGERILVMDGDHATAELATVTAMSATTLTVTLANNYAADFGIFGLGDTSTLEPTGTSVAYGTSAVANGATTVTITHNLPYTPRASDINITQTAVTTNPVGSVWLTAVGATTFTVNVAADPGASTFAFGWRIFPLPYRF